MENNILRHLSFNYKSILIDEIALEGLEGITLSMLWKRIECRISAPITEKLKIRLWDYIIKYSNIQVYVLPEPIPDIEIIDRFDCIHESSGYLNDPTDYLDGPYEYCPVDNEFGSCRYYHNRTLLEKDEISKKPCSEIEAQYGCTLVLVCSLEDRWRALAPHIPITYLNYIQQPQYCILELVGRGRYNGQTTTGKTNLMKISKDPKFLFYNRKSLQDSDLVRVHVITQYVCEKGTKSLLLRLKRFHEETLKSMPKRGIIRDIIDHLLTKPNFCDRTDEMIKKGLMTAKLSKKLYKKVDIFSFQQDQKDIPTPNSSKSQSKIMKRKYISLFIQAEESSHSDSEEDTPQLKCQYKVGIGMLRQAYELFLEAGLKGLTHIEIAQLLGVRFYTCRAICRVLKYSNLVREFLEDKGRQRKARYIAVAATRKIDIRYAEEKEKLLSFLDSSKTDRKRKCVSTSEENNVETPAKKSKKDNEEGGNSEQQSIAISTNEETNSENNENLDITEIKVLEGLQFPNAKSFLSNKDNLTLRQLKYANGILKILNEKLCISGYTALSNMVAKEINEPPMASKSMKAFIQKFVTDGYIKIYSVKWPGHKDRYSRIICANSVKSTDPVIKARCQEIRMKSIAKKVDSNINSTPTLPKSHKFTFWQKHVKLQKLHECLVNFAYFSPDESPTHNFPKGCVLIADFIPWLTVQFVVSNMIKSNIINEVCSKITTDMLPLKIREIPIDIYEVLLKSNSFNNTIRQNLKILAMFGLIQLVYYTSISTSDYHQSSIYSFMVYVNRHAKILDTRGEWPRLNVDKTMLEISFVFDSPAEVLNFWEKVFNISINTKVTVTDRGKNKKLMPPVRLHNEIKDFDNGERYGDEMGACGFDSYFYLEIPWSWRTVYPKTMRPTAMRPIPKKVKSKVEAMSVKKNVKKITQTKTQILKSAKQPTVLGPRIRKSSTIGWSKTEDMIIILCKIAASIMSPTVQVGSLKVRNFVAKDLISILDPRKTVNLCHLRAKALKNDSAVIHNVDCILNYIRRNKTVMEKYDNLQKKIRLRYSTNLTRYINMARVAMLELVWTISQIIQSQSYSSKIGCIVKNYEEFHENYTLTHSTVNQSSNLFRLVDNLVLKEAIIMSVMTSFRSTVSCTLSKRIYSVFNVYPEATLRAVFEQVRKSGVLVSRDKSSNPVTIRHNCENVVQMYYKLSSLYQRKWNSRLNHSFADDLATIIEGLPETNIKGTPDINCFMCEMQASGLLQVVIATVPVITGDCGTNILQEENINVIDIETKLKLKSGTLSWKNNKNIDTFSDIYKDIVPVCEESFEVLTKSYIWENDKSELKDDIVSYLMTKRENGATFDELKNTTGCTTQELKEKLRYLESEKVIRRLGYYENVVVLAEMRSSWTIVVENESVVPVPWLTLDKDIKYDIFFKWAGVVMNRIYENPGCSVTYLTDVCEYLSSRHIQDICTVLERCKCITLQNLVRQEVDLFSDGYIEPEFEEYNEYSAFELMLAFPLMNSLTKYSFLRKKMLETQKPYVVTDINNYPII